MGNDMSQLSHNHSLEVIRWPSYDVSRKEELLPVKSGRIGACCPPDPQGLDPILTSLMALESLQGLI